MLSRNMLHILPDGKITMSIKKSSDSPVTKKTFTIKQKFVFPESIGALFMDLNISAELCNFGTFTSFIIICLAVLILRKTEPDRKRPFKVPFCPWFPIFGILTCALLMYCKFSAKSDSSLYFLIWLLIGVAIYAGYSYKAKRSEE